MPVILDVVCVMGLALPLSTPQSLEIMQRARRARKHPFTGFAIAVVAVGIATLVRWELGQALGMQGTPFTTYYLAILLAAVTGGLWPGLLAVVLSVLLAWIVFIPPELSVEVEPGKVISVLMFLLVSTLIVIVVVAMNRAFDWVHDQEQNIRTLIEASPNGVLVVDEVGRITLLNKATEELFGYDRSELLGRPIEELVPSSKTTEHLSERLRFMRQPAVRPAKGRDLTGRRKDGSEFSIEVGLTPLHQEGKSGVLATVVDISDRKAAEERQQFLVKELEHRSQNLFAVIRSIAARSLGSGHTLAEAKEAFEARLLALARAHKMLGEAAWRGAPLVEIIKSELSAFEKNLSVSGCDLFVNTTAAQQFALIVHELATNAAKHGALSSSEGKVVIEGRVERVNGDRMFAIAWKESGGPPVKTPRRKGFGSTILVNAAKKFGRDAKLCFDQEGLKYELRVPLNTIEAAQTRPTRRA